MISISVVRIAALLTCHNRREKTLACLRALRAQELPGWNPDIATKKDNGAQNEASDSGNRGADVYSLPPTSPSDFKSPLSLFFPDHCVIEVFLVDDGSTDGTANAAREIWPEATIIQGNGNLFWCGGMRVAWAEAARTDPDCYLLLNDDTVIQPNTLSELLKIAPDPNAEIIVVAPIADPDTGEIVFGGHRGQEPKPLEPDGVPLPCDTMNANCALVMRAVFQKIGMFHNAFTHAMGDFDYGFTATRAGVKILQAGRVLGTSKPNIAIRTWRDRDLSRRERFHLLWFNPKGLPFLEWATYARRNMGWIWPYRAISPALRILAGR